MPSAGLVVVVVVVVVGKHTRSDPVESSKKTGPKNLFLEGPSGFAIVLTHNRLASKCQFSGSVIV